MDRWRLSRSFVMTVMAGCIAMAFTWQPAGALQLPGDPSAALLFSVEQAMLDLTNADRTANGVDPLVFDPETLEIARERAASQIYVPSLTHYDENGELAFVHLLADAQIGYQIAGENLARATADDASAVKRVEQALRKSPTHRSNIPDRTLTKQ